MSGAAAPRIIKLEAEAISDPRVQSVIAVAVKGFAIGSLICGAKSTTAILAIATMLYASSSTQGLLIA